MAERRRRRPSQDSEEESDGSEDPKNITKDSECESEGPPAEEYESAEEVEVKKVVPKEKIIELTVVEPVKHNEEEEKEEEEEEETKSAGEDVILEDDYTEDGDEEESWQDGERQEGDGEESDVTDLKERILDDDEDRKNPQYIPKKGVFYEHDNRLDEPQEESERQLLKKNKKLWKDDGKWIHDRYRSDEQAPKTREELIAIYGYDIRNEDGPPRAGRRRRYGRGPNKYTRKWDDENAYRLARGQGLHIRVTRGGRGRGRSHSADSISDKPRFESITSKDAESVSEHDNDSVSSKEIVKNSFRESISDSKFIKKEFIPEIKVLTPKEIEQFRRGAPPRDRRPFTRGRFDRGSPKPRFIPNNINNNNVKLEIEFDKLHIGDGDVPRVSPEIKTEPVLPEKNLEKNIHPADLGIKKETKSPENLHMGDRRGVQPSVRHNVTSNRPKRYSSQRQRTMTDTPPYQSHIMEAPQYFDTGYQAPVFADPPSPNAPQAPPPTQQYPSYNMPYQDAYGLRPITNPPRFYSPVTIATAQTVLPTPYITAGAGLINYGTPHYPQYPIQQYPSPPPPPQPQPQEVYRGGVMYFNTQNQHSNPVWTPPRRPRAAIPIVPPPDDNKNYREEKKEIIDSPPNAAQEQSTEVKVEG